MNPTPSTNHVPSLDLGQVDGSIVWEVGWKILTTFPIIFPNFTLVGAIFWYCWWELGCMVSLRFKLYLWEVTCRSCCSWCAKHLCVTPIEKPLHPLSITLILFKVKCTWVQTKKIEIYNYEINLQVELSVTLYIVSKYFLSTFRYGAVFPLALWDRLGVHSEV